MASTLSIEMLVFDGDRSAFLYDGVVIDRATSLPDIATVLAGDTQAIKGQPGRALFETRDRPINMLLSFNGAHPDSGYFWAATDAPGSWSDCERIEAERRAAHVRIMRDLFGAESYQDGRVQVRLIRDPRSYLEQIAFVFTPVDAALSPASLSAFDAVIEKARRLITMLAVAAEASTDQKAALAEAADTVAGYVFAASSAQLAGSADAARRACSSFHGIHKGLCHNGSAHQFPEIAEMTMAIAAAALAARRSLTHDLGLVY